MYLDKIRVSNVTQTVLLGESRARRSSQLSSPTPCVATSLHRLLKSSSTDAECSDLLVHTAPVRLSQNGTLCVWSGLDMRGSQYVKIYAS